MKRKLARIEWAPKNWTIGIEWFQSKRWHVTKTRTTIYLCLLPLIIIFEHYREWTPEEIANADQKTMRKFHAAETNQ